MTGGEKAGVGLALLVAFGLGAGVGHRQSSGEATTGGLSAPEPQATTVPPRAVTTPTPTPPPSVSQWRYSRSVDEMTGKTSYTAAVTSQNSVEFDFPYNGVQHGTLTIRRHPRFGNDVIFSIEKGQLLCPSYEGCTVLVRFDEEAPNSYSASPAADNSTETLFIQNYQRFVTQLGAAKVIRVSPKVYQQGNVVFTFDVTGFDAKQLLPQ